MKAATQALRNTLMQDMAITAQPRLIAEWEYNRYFTPTVTVTPDQTTADTDWLASYDTNSITLPFRPTAGIARARVDSGVVPLSGPYRDPGTTRFYPTPDEPLYSYFASLQHSQLAASVNGDGYEFDSPIEVSVTYADTIAVNKIVVGFETGYAAPQSFSVQVSPDGTAWQTVFSNGVLDPDGTFTIWHSSNVGSGWGGTAWDVNPAYDSPVVIKGVRVIVYSMDAPYSHLDVLQVSPRLENDLTPYLVTYQVGMSQDSPSFIAPLGKASSNTGSITLSNIDGRFNDQNVNSLYYGMIEKKVRMTMDLGIDTAAHGGGMEYIREFTMWTDSWGASNNSTIDVQLKDSSVVLQERNMPAIFLTNATVGQIIWQTLDTIGMTNYQYTRSDPDYGQVIPYYWPSDTAEASNPRWGRLRVNTTNPPTTTIWDELSALCESTQTGLYFDEYDKLQIKSREQMYNTGKLPDYNLDAVANGSKLPDVVSTQVDYALATNQVELTYKPAAMSNDQNGFPKMEVVWQPTSPATTDIVPSSSTGDTTVTLRASAMVKDLLTTGTDLWIHQADALIWPYESDVNIQAEMIHYKGKEYGYYDAANNLQTAICTSAADKASYDALNENLYWKNAFTGRFIVTARGKYGSRVADHHVQSNSYASLQTSWNHSGAQALGTGWTTYNDGYITQTTPVTVSTPNFNNLCHVRMHNNAVLPKPPVNPRTDQPGVNSETVWYGAKFRWPGQGQNVPDATSNSNWRVGGLFMAGDASGNGYYMEVCSTPEIAGWEQTQWRHELCLLGLPAGGVAFQIPGTNSAVVDDNGSPTGNRGFAASISEDLWFTIDVAYTDQDAGGNTNVTVYLNGVFAGEWIIAPTARPAYTNQWRFGSYTRGPVFGLDIDYLYAVGQDDTNPFGRPDQSTFLDLVTGGYQSKWIHDNVVFACANPLLQPPSGIVQYPEAVGDAYVQFDEFGPAVHEVRQFDVEFSSQFIPVASSYLYLTHPKADCIAYYSDASGASFMVANASRDNITVNGPETDFTGGSITYSISIYGRVVYTSQNDNIKIVRDEAAIRKQGLIRTQFTSRYIQTEEMAGVIGDWITSLWSMGIDQVTVALFGNPLLQVGDLVTINYPAKGMAPSTHQYFITSVKGSFDKGYSTEVVMRRARTL